MKLLDLRLRPSTAVIQSCLGSFTSPDQEEILLIKPGGTVELHAIVKTTTQNDNDDDDEDDEDERTYMKLITRVETRSILRSCSVLRYPGEQKDVAVIGSDSGSVSVLEFKDKNGTLGILHCTDFGKTGCRRVIPGQYVASDPKGRAIMIGAVEKRKLVYVLNRDAAGKPTIASPLEANRGRAITLAMVGIDNGFDNPIFASLEMQYDGDNQDIIVADANEADSKGTQLPETQLAYYELDLGLNHVSRRWATTALQGACCVAAVPGVADGGPGGVLVGSEDWLEYLHDTMDEQTSAGDSNHNKNAILSKRICCALPRRRLHPKDRTILVTQITVHRQKKSKFFAVAQTELGDLYKVTLKVDKSVEPPKVEALEVSLLDTLPAAISINVSKMGYLFAAVETGDHYLYQFQRLDVPDAPTCRSNDCQDALAKVDESMEYWSKFRSVATNLAPTFDPTDLNNLRKVHLLENSAPTTGVMIGELAGNEVSPQVYLMSGRGPTSAMKIIRHGVSISELAVSDLPGVPGGIFTVADNSGAEGSDSKKDRFIVVSFADATLVLSVGDSVEEVGKESGFLTNSPTLACSPLGDDGALCQVHPAGVRHILRGGNAKQWHCPGLKKIECASANRYQVIIALAGGEVIYFELDPMNQTLKQCGSKDLKADVCCLDVGTISTGRSRSMFAAVGCRDQTVRIVSLTTDKLLVQLSSIALKSRPQSVSLVKWSNVQAGHTEELDLVIGLDDGSSLRSVVDTVTGEISTSSTTRFLGTRPVSVSNISLGSNVASLMLSSRPWIGRHDDASGKYMMAPLSYVPLDHGCSFCSDMIREGIVATAGNTLRILSIDSTAIEGGEDEAFNAQRVGLRYTPRQMTLLSVTSDASSNKDKRKVVIAVAESDVNEYGLDAKKAMGLDEEGHYKPAKKDDGDAMDMDDDSDNENAGGDEEEDEEDDEEKEAKKTTIRGPIPSGKGNWGSCVRILDPSNQCTTLDCVEMGRNEAALCCASVRFHSKGRESFLAVGVVAGMTMHPLKQTGSYILLYRVEGGGHLKLLHRTTVDDGPILALAHFEGRLLAGVGNSLRLYEMGKRQLLRKCELRGLPTFVKTLQTVGDRAFVGDMMQSIRIVRYETSHNRLVVLASDPCPRMIVSQEMLDWNTVAVGDKFGCISILRLPESAETSALDLSGAQSLWDSSKSDMTPRLELLAQYYVGEVVTGITRSALVAGGSDSLIYVTVSGRIAALMPLTTRDDVEFYEQLESSLRTDAPRPTGRDPKAYRSYYSPVMHVMDGDLCDAFNGLSHEAQSEIAETLGKEIGDVKKKLEDTRNTLL
mmetsp:Transcript_24482/g.67789  ORF Transcript_24482/g.67789 Transcript_24482/m.67789 type:complete len:1316 (-) Transcript_24482:141-4088(-)